MELIPYDELQPKQSFHFAPMVDFLFLMLSFFATLAVSRASLHDAEIDLVHLKKEAGSELLNSSRNMQQINVSITAEGRYKWLTEFHEYPMEDLPALQAELTRQYQVGALPLDKAKTEVLLHIDQKAPWSAIAHAIFGIRELGFSARPVYEPQQ